MLQLERISSELGSQGFAVVDDFCSTREIDALNADLLRSFEAGDFHRAAIGRGANEKTSADVRRDSIVWFQAEALSAPQSLLWQRLGELKSHLNESLLLGLWELEGHYANYPAGGFYKRHLDRFRDSDTRVVSVVLYLNKNWRAEDGGCLNLYVDAKTVQIEPVAGRLVCFLSAEIEHEVQPSHQTRLSFAGWFRRRE